MQSCGTHGPTEVSELWAWRSLGPESRQTWIQSAKRKDHFSSFVVALARPEELILGPHVSIWGGLMTTGKLMAWGKAGSCQPLLSWIPWLSGQTLFQSSFHCWGREVNFFFHRILFFSNRPPARGGGHGTGKNYEASVNTGFFWPEWRGFSEVLSCVKSLSHSGPAF